MNKEEELEKFHKDVEMCIDLITILKSESNKGYCYWKINNISKTNRIRKIVNEILMKYCKY